MIVYRAGNTNLRHQTPRSLEEIHHKHLVLTQDHDQVQYYLTRTNGQKREVARTLVSSQEPRLRVRISSSPGKRHSRSKARIEVQFLLKQLLLNPSSQVVRLKMGLRRASSVGLLLASYDKPLNEKLYTNRKALLTQVGTK